MASTLLATVLMVVSYTQCDRVLTTLLLSGYTAVVSYLFSAAAPPCSAVSSLRPATRYLVGPFGPIRRARVTGKVTGMPSTQTVTCSLIDLTRDESLALLGSVPVGRLVHAHDVFPCIRPVNFILQPNGICFRTSAHGDVLRLATDRAQVVFEADAFDAAAQFGWSVVVLGQLERVVDPLALTWLADSALVTWADGGRSEVVRVSLGQVSGRRAGGPARAADHP